MLEYERIAAMQALAEEYRDRARSARCRLDWVVADVLERQADELFDRSLEIGDKGDPALAAMARATEDEVFERAVRSLGGG